MSAATADAGTGRASTLDCRGVTVRAGRATILSGVDLAVGAGEWVNLVGPNGGGKTTLLRAFAGLRPFEGRVELDGRDATGMGRRELARTVGLVPQSPVVPAGMTVAQYVLLGRTPHQSPLAAESAADRAAAAGALRDLDLGDLADRAVDTLSGGERQRVVVARLVAQATPVALLDEPTAALDVGHQQQVLDLVERLRRDRPLTVVATLHDRTLAGQSGDRVALLVGGRVVADGPARDVLTEEAVRHHYGARVRIVDGEDGPLGLPVREG